MSRALLIPQSSNLIDEVVAQLEPDGLDYSVNLVAFPGKRPAHFLRKALGQMAGKSYIPPRIFSIDNLIDYLYREMLDRPESELQPADAVCILHELQHESGEAIGGEYFKTLDAFLPLGLKLYEELEELAIANLTPRRVAEAMAEAPVDTARIAGRLYGPFYDAVKVRGFSTRALKYREVAAWLTPQHLAGFCKVILAGFYALTGTEVTIFKRLNKDDRCVFIYQDGPGIRKHIEQTGLKIERREGATTRTNLRFYESPDTHGQVFGLSTQIKQIMNQNEPLDERTVIVLASSEALFPVLHQTLPFLPQDGYNISLGYPVSRTPVYGFLNKLMNLVSSVHESRFYTPVYLQFVLHPYTKSVHLKRRSDITRILFHTIEEHFIKEGGGTFVTLEEVEQRYSIFTRAAEIVDSKEVRDNPDLLMEHLKGIHDNTIRPFLNIENVGDFARKCIAVLLYVDGNTTARYHPLFRPYVETLIEAMETLANSLLAPMTFHEPSGYFTFFRSYVSTVNVPFAGTPLHGVQVLGFLETRNLQFDRVFVLDVNDQVIPGSGQKYTLIPNQIREHLGLSTRQEKETIAAYYFDLLLGGAKEAHLFYATNPLLERSRFIEQRLWEMQKKDKRSDETAHVTPIRYTLSLSASIPAPIPKSPDVAAAVKQLQYSATMLDTYLKCPIKFYYTYVLKLKEREDVTGEIEAMDIGNFVHKVLAQFFEPAVGALLRKENLSVERLNTIIDGLFVEYFGEASTGNNHLLKRQVKYQLERFLKEYQLPLLANGGVSLLGLEKKITVTKNGRSFTGKIDRIEQRAEKTFILDYKTGSNENYLKIRFDKLLPDRPETWSDVIGSLQLPMYMLLYSEAERKNVESLVPAYLMLGKGEMSDKIELRMLAEGMPTRIWYDTLDRIIFALLDELVNPAAPFMPAHDVEKHCPDCQFKYICGTQWVQSWGQY
jgi:ATP-dependent helicase/nuclease subunit B